MKRFFRNIIEFLPYLVMFYMWFFGSFMSSLGVQNQPGIVKLGWITTPAVICIIIAIIRTYKELPKTGRLPAVIDKGEMPSSRFNIKFGVIGYGLAILAIIISTNFYYANYEELKVPSKDDPTLWQNPAFENTILYEQMVPEEREKLLSEGIPNKYNIKAMIIRDIIGILIASICFIHCYKNFGFWMASCFLLGSFVYTGVIESALILSGRFIFGGVTHNMFGDVFHGTFWYPKAAMWFIHCPIMICIGWYYVAYCCVWVATKAFPRMNVYLRAMVGGFIAMNLDMWIDPVSTSPEIMTWIWGKGDPIELFGIPVWNFWGWFMVISLFAVLWEKLPVIKEKWGTAKGTVNFFLIILLCDVIVAVLIYLYNIVIGGILALAGVQHAILFPPGW
jgi:hypothetical protein